MPKFKKSKETLPPAPSLQPFERSSKLSKGQIIANNFLGGFFWAIGGVIGLAAFLSIISLLSEYIDVIPYIGNFIADILDYLKELGSISR